MRRSVRLLGCSLICLAMTSMAAFAVDIGQVPLEAVLVTPPPIVMLVFDNSGSMDMEFMTEQEQGLFEGAYYLFPDDAYSPKPDHTYGTGHALNELDRRKWRSQWSGYNFLYYTPQSVYKPWPSTAEHGFGNADLNHPATDPMANGSGDPKFKMASIFSSIKSGTGPIDVLNAHYFTHQDSDSDGRWEKGEPVYLVTWTDNDGDGRIDLSESLGNDQRRYYRVVDDGDGIIQENELISVHNEGEINLIRAARFDASGRFSGFLTDKQELQNFVNWFTYYRRRALIAKAAAGSIVSHAGKFAVGLYTVNPGQRISARTIDSRLNAGSTDEPVKGTAAHLMDAIYELDSKGSTPLRHALDQVGRYLRQDYPSELGRSPFYSNADGGNCQHACAVVISDGFWNGNFSGVGNADGTSGKPFADAWADTLADVAMAYFKTDLNRKLPDTVPPTKCDRSTHQHMNTYAVLVGRSDQEAAVPGPKSDQSLTPCLDVDPALAGNWIRPSGAKGVEAEGLNGSNFVFHERVDTSGTIEDLRHAALNGRGSLVNADSSNISMKLWPEIQTDLNTTAYSSGMVVNTISMIDDSMVFQMAYRPEDWSGEVSAFTLIAGSGQGVSPGTNVWTASKLLPGDSSFLWNQRRIVTYGGPWPRPQGVAFRYNQMSAKQLKALGWEPDPTPIAEAQRRQLIDYIRGKPVPGCRVRETLLGDIAHCTPVLFGRTLFVGANDGMLHAFDTASGAERFAYIPGLIYDHLKLLSDVHYVDQHRFYVDGPLHVGEVTVGDHQREAYLVGGLGAGGKGYFCLSVGQRLRSTIDGGYGDYHWIRHVDDLAAGSSESQAAGFVRWEYPCSDASDDSMDNNGDGLVDEPGEVDPNLGYSFSQAYAVNANCAANSYLPVVIFGNGYNSESQKAVLYVLAADSGKIIRIIDTGSAGDNGLSTPALIDVDLDRRVDYAYAGDLNGNLWKFDLTAQDPGQWGVAFGEDKNHDGVIDAAQGDLPEPLFQAPDQPITGRPDAMIMHASCISQAPGMMVFFGTGRYLGTPDRDDTTQQSLYAIWDYGDDSDDSESLGAIIDRSNGRLSSGLSLIRKQIVDETVKDGQNYRQVSEDHIAYELVEDLEDGDGYASNNVSEMKMKNPRHYAGWFLDLPLPTESSVASSERVIGDVLVRAGKIIVPSFMPDNRLCGGGSGRSWLYLLAACNGGTPLDVNREPLLSVSYEGKISSRPLILKDAQKPGKDMILFAGQDGRVRILEIPGENWGKVYWRQSR